MRHYEIPSTLSQEEIIRLISKGEQYFESQMKTICDSLLELADLHFIGLTGPTCSGKTTAANLITKALKAQGKQIHVISIDDFYYDKPHLLELTKKKGLTNLDYDSEETIDIALLASCVEALKAGKRIKLPKFNFTTGLREAGEEILPSAEDVFLFEGIQVLYPGVDRILRSEQYQSIHIAPQSSIAVGGEIFEPNEIRLMRRLVRDYHFRNADPEFTLTLWQSVRENEEKLIFPNVHLCDYKIDSTMPYEIGILKPFLENILQRTSKDLVHGIRACAILDELKNVQSLSADLIPQNSLYKEFI